jgi:hypothetical protein
MKDMDQLSPEVIYQLVADVGFTCMFEVQPSGGSSERRFLSPGICSNTSGMGYTSGGSKTAVASRPQEALATWGCGWPREFPRDDRGTSLR